MGRGAMVLWLALSMLHFVVASYEARAYGVVDFPIFVDQARQFLASGVLYPEADNPAAYAPAAAVYKFPPLYAMLLLPFSHDGPSEALNTAHWILQLALYALSVALALGWLGLSWRSYSFWLALSVALNFEPFFETLWRLQLEGPILLLLTLSLVSMRRSRPALIGAALGFAGMLKVYPAFFLLYFVLRRRWALLGWAAATAFLVTVASLIVVGAEQTSVFFLKVLPAMGDELPLISSENVALGRYGATHFGLGRETAALLGKLVGWLLMAASALLILLRPAPPAASRRAGSEWLLFVPATLLLMPNAWVNYQLLLLLPLLVLVQQGFRDGQTDWAILLPTALAFALSLFYAPCAESELAWPCARTPTFLGVAPLPRALHDAFVELRGLTNLLVWGAMVRALWPASRS